MYNGNNGLMNSCLERLVKVTLCNATCNRLFLSSDNVRLYSKPFNHDGNTLNMWSENVSDHFGTFVVSYQMSSTFVILPLQQLHYSTYNTVLRPITLKVYSNCL